MTKNNKKMLIAGLTTVTLAFGTIAATVPAAYAAPGDVTSIAVAIDAKTKYVADPTLKFGEKKVVKITMTGNRVIDYREEANGQKTKIGERIVDQAQDGITNVGNRKLEVKEVDGKKVTYATDYKINPDTGEVTNEVLGETKPVEGAEAHQVHGDQNNDQNGQAGGDAVGGTDQKKPGDQKKDDQKTNDQKTDEKKADDQKTAVNTTTNNNNQKHLPKTGAALPITAAVAAMVTGLGAFAYRKRMASAE